jgi:hypothetical protein
MPQHTRAGREGTWSRASGIVTRGKAMELTRLNNRYVEGAVLVAVLVRDVEYVTRNYRLLK